MQTNKAQAYTGPVTHESGIAAKINDIQALERSVMTTMLWEDAFYEDGVSIATRISDLVARVPDAESKRIMVKAKIESKLRHAPLWIAIARAKIGYLKSEELVLLLDRVDAVPEFLAMYWADGRKAIDHQIRKGIDKALRKFDEYQFAKYDRPKAIKLRDVFRMIRPKPANDEQAALWKKIVHGGLTTPDTWETQLSSGADKKATFMRLIEERKLGDLAFLRNLRGMLESGVDAQTVRASFPNRQWKGILATQFIAAAKYAPTLEDVIESAMFKALDQETKITGRVALLVDVSGSMNDPLSKKSEMRRIEAASALAMMIREVAIDASIFTFENNLEQIAPRRGFALRDAIGGPRGGTQLWNAVQVVGTLGKWDRMIVVTDEQTSDNRIGALPCEQLVIINVGNAQNGVSYGKGILHIDGWSDSVVRFLVQALEGR